MTPTTKYENAMRCRIPHQRMLDRFQPHVPEVASGIPPPWRTRPSKKSLSERIVIFLRTATRPAASTRFREKAIAVPTMNRNHGMTMSAKVSPSHGAWLIV